MCRCRHFTLLCGLVLILVVFLLVFDPHGCVTLAVSEAYPTLFTPAGWAFSIWGIIFLLEGAFSVYQLTPSARGSALVQKGIG